MDIGCGPYKRLPNNFYQSESPYTFNVKFSKTAQNSAMNNGNSTKMLYICKESLVDDIKVSIKVTRLCFMVLICYFITSKTLYVCL